MTGKRLKGRRIAVLAADGFEKTELSIPMKALKHEGAKVDVVSLRHGRIRGVNLHEPARRVHVDATVQEADPADYDGLFIPGGFINPDLLRQSADAREFVRAFELAKKPIATMCHGPWVLASAGIVEERSLTSWPGIRDDVVNAGATWLDEEVVRDGNLLTSRGPQDMKPFVRELIDFFETPEPAHAERSIPPLTSSPRHDQPPAMVLKAMRWVPRPSLRTAVAMLGIGLLGAVALARRSA